MSTVPIPVSPTQPANIDPAKVIEIIDKLRTQGGLFSGLKHKKFSMTFVVAGTLLVFGYFCLTVSTISAAMFGFAAALVASTYNIAQGMSDAAQVSAIAAGALLASVKDVED